VTITLLPILLSPGGVLGWQKVKKLLLPKIGLEEVV
jgi:hypothetical protein